ncbi:MAG TPA: DNA repair protein RadC [Acetobacteraceae bacterium]|nr:DNA repair protein RadC [Acetobacteraceae bacterium]
MQQASTKTADLLAELEALAARTQIQRRPAPTRAADPPPAASDLSPQADDPPPPVAALPLPAEEPPPPETATSRAPSSPVSAQGHRARMRARLLTAGPAALNDRELLEMLLFIAVPRRDTKPIARALIARFGSFAAAIAASAVELQSVEGLGEAGIAALKTVQAAAQRLIRADIADRPVFQNWQALMDYLNATLGREKVEQCRILFLDSRNRLLADEVQTRGTVNHTPVYPREVVKRALELHATALILVHNHPSGDTTPSAADIAMTRDIRQAAEALSLVLHDHVIVGNGTWLSFRREGLL